MNVTQVESFSGPLPPPTILEHYNRIVPGAAERIIAMAEQQGKHRRDIEARVIRSDVVNARLGLIFGFLIGASGVVGGVVAAIKGAEGVGTLISALSLGSLVGAFIYGSQQRKAEREERRREP